MTDKSYTEHMASPAFMVICDGACDQICGTKAEAQREARDLKRMGFEGVKVRAFTTWADAHAYEDKLRGY